MFDFRSAALAVLNTEIEALEQLEQYVNDDFANTCKLILANHDGKVVVMGMGKSGHIGKKLQLHLLAQVPQHFCTSIMKPLMAISA